MDIYWNKAVGSQIKITPGVSVLRRLVSFFGQAEGAGNLRNTKYGQ